MKRLLSMVLLFVAGTSCGGPPPPVWPSVASTLPPNLSSYPMEYVSVHGVSMEPTIHDGARVIMFRDRYADVRIGQVVDYVSLYWHHPIDHRVVAGWPGYWVTCGDGNHGQVDRGYVTEANYIGLIIPPQ